MKECVDCHSNNVVKNVNNGTVFCYDCKSQRVYRECYECGKPIKEEPFNGSGGWHDDVKWIKYSNYTDELVTCWENHKIDQEVEADCS